MSDSKTAHSIKSSKNSTPFISKFLWRCIIGITLFLVILFCVLFDFWPFFVLLLVAEILCFYELHVAFSKKLIYIPYLTTISGAFISLLSAYFWGFGGLLIGTTIGVFLMFFQIFFRKIDGIEHSTDWGYIWRTFVLPKLLFVYIVFFLGFYVLLYTLENPGSNGNLKVLTVITLTMLSDVGAFFMGKYFGKHKFAKISPKKTIEGFFGGLLLTLVGAFIVLPWWLGFNPFESFLNFMTLFLLCLIIWIFGTIGDLVESSIKRFVGVKDMSDLLWGHGGVLDRIDSLIFVIPFAFLFFLVFPI